MWKPQFSSSSSTNFGLGFLLDTFEGERKIGHGGAIYGFSTQVAALPDRKLGVIIIATADSTNAVVNHLSDEALSLMLSVSEHKPLPVLPSTTAIAPGLARKAAGHYVDGNQSVDLREETGHLFLTQSEGGGIRRVEGGRLTLGARRTCRL